MATPSNELEENLQNYKSQLKQVEAALLIDEENEDLKKLKQDLDEVITLTLDLMQINEVKIEEEHFEKEIITEKVKQWKAGDQVLALKKADGLYHNARIDMIADDGVSCSIKFENSGSVDIIKVSSLKEIENISTDKKDGGEQSAGGAGGKFKQLTKDELEKKREAKKKKLLKKKQRMKDFEEAREAGKQKWQSFYQKGSLKGKHKVKGLNKKSIFASREDGKGKIGIGTCGTSGKAMTTYTAASEYMYKK